MTEGRSRGRPPRKRLSGAQIARLCGISPPKVTRDKRKEVGGLKVNTEGTFFIDEPVNYNYLASYGVDIEQLKFAAVDGRLMEAFDDMGRPCPVVTDSSKQEFDPQEKVIQDTRLKRISADLKSLEYAKRMGVLVDIETLNVIFGRFYDCIMNDFLTLPESVADLLKMIAVSSDNPEKEIARELKDRIRVILDNAKEAASDMLPNEKTVRYVLTQPDGDTYEPNENESRD